MLGSNMRLTEIQCAIALEQLKKLPKLIEKRVELANCLTERLSKLEFLATPKVRAGSSHVYYLYPIKFDEKKAGMSREKYADNIRELGIPLYRLATGYMKPLYLDPIFKDNLSFKNGYPYNLIPKDQQPNYSKGICPVVERFYEKELIVTAYNYHPLTKKDMNDIAEAFSRAVEIK